MLSVSGKSLRRKEVKLSQQHTLDEVKKRRFGRRSVVNNGQLQMKESLDEVRSSDETSFGRSMMVNHEERKYGRSKSGRRASLDEVKLRR